MANLPVFDDAWVVAQRGPRNEVNPARPYALHVEEERTRHGTIEPVATVFALPHSKIKITLGMDVLYYGHTLGTFHMENGIMITADGPRSFYAPPNTERVLPAGLIVKDGNKAEVYCPPDVKLSQERGIAPELVMTGSPVPSWCRD